MALIDVSVPIRPGMFVFPGNPEVAFERAQSIPDGDEANVTRLDLGAHTATHLDAPKHFFEDGGGAEMIPVDAGLGPAVVVDATSVKGEIHERDLASLAVPAEAERVLFKTTNSELWARDEFEPDFVRLGASAAAELVRRGIRLVGIDYLSIGRQEVHRTLLGAGVAVLEGLDLRAVGAGRYELICLALRLEGCDGAPARALLRAP